MSKKKKTSISSSAELEMVALCNSFAPGQLPEEYQKWADWYSSQRRKKLEMLSSLSSSQAAQGAPTPAPASCAAVTTPNTTPVWLIVLGVLLLLAIL